MERLLLSLAAIFLISKSTAQAQFIGCFTDRNCSDRVVTERFNAEDCCVNNIIGMYYNDGGQCFQCIVYGWGLDNFTRPEALHPYEVSFAYFKGPSDANLMIAINYTGEGTASEEDFSINQIVHSLPLDPGGTTTIVFQADRVALEPDETFVLELSLLSVAVGLEPSLPNVFFRSRQEFIIQDSTTLVFRLRESDRAVDEGDGFIPIEVVSNEVKLASDILLVLTPMIAPENFMPGPNTRPFARANTIPDRIDFFTEPITLNFIAGGPILLVGNVTILDDLIDEALEFFVVTLSFQTPDMVPPLTSIETNGGDIIRIDIIDNDDIFIGFPLPNTTYQEVEASHRIQFIKGENNVTEQTILFVVNLALTAPEGLKVAMPSTNTGNNDFKFPTTSLLSIAPDENDTFANLTIFADDLPEVREGAQLRLSLPTDPEAPGFEILHEFPEFFIIIQDDDQLLIGFEQTSYTVNESIGMLEVCARMFEPLEDSEIGSVLVFIEVETVQDSADGNDYTFGPRILLFSNSIRRSCFNVEIQDDNRYELEEQFSLQIVAIELGSGLPDNIVLKPFRSTIVIRGSPFGGCYSNSVCSGERLGPSNAEECCVKSVGTHFSDGTTCFECIVSVIQPVRVPQDLRLTTRNLMAPMDGFEYSCVVNGVSLTAQYENESSILCIVGSENLTLPAGVGSSKVVILLMSNVNHTLNSTMQLIAVTLYDCRNLASGCSECIVARSEFACGWCGSSCEVMQECSTDRFVIEGDNCPAPIINSFSPMSGPVDGGTAITVNGTDLGVSFDDIQSSNLTLGGVACSPNDTNYMLGRQFVCETTNFGTVGSKNFSLMIGSRAAIVNAGSFTAVDPIVSSVTPSFGPMAGGTTVAVSGTGLDVGNQDDTRVSLEVSGTSYVCNILSIQSHEIRCTTTAAILSTDALVVVSIDAARVNNSGVVFSYRNNPDVITVSPSNTISSGGIMLTFSGLNLDVVQQPVLEVYPPMGGAPLMSNCSIGEGSTACSIVNITTITCSTPDLSSTSLTALDYALLFDDVLPITITQAISIQSDPSNFRLDTPQEVLSGTATVIHIVGDNLDSVETSEIEVTVGGEECVKTTENGSDISCTAPLEPPGGVTSAIINVTVGSNIFQELDQRLNYTVIQVTVPASVISAESREIIISFSVIIIIFVLVVCVLMIVFIYFYLKSRRKSLSIASQQQNMELMATGTREILDGNTSLIKSELDEIAKSIPDSFKISGSKLKLSSTTIGQGEFGIVYKGVLIDWNSVPMQGVAVKTLKGLFSVSSVQSMMCEVNKMQDLHHPHVMSLIGVCLDAGPGIAIVMPYMANGSLLDYFKKERGSLELDDDCEIHQILAVRKLLLKMCHQIALGMAYLAEQKFVHRDLAARNCMLDSGGSIRVGDFGLAEDVYASGYFRQNDRANVKVPYKWMALESLNDAIFTEKTDVWSYGVTVWEVFNGGRTPYAAVDPLSLIRLLEEGRRLERPLNAACATEISVVMRKCWREDPEERPTFSQLSSIVERLLTSVAGYTELSMVLVDTSQEEEEHKYDYIPSPAEGPHHYGNPPADPITAENSASGLGDSQENEELNHVPTLTPTEALHHYGDLPSVDPLTTENSAYGVGEEMTTADNNVPMLTLTEAAHHYGDLLSVDPLITENSAYGVGEEMTTADNNVPMLTPTEAPHHYDDLSVDPLTTENSAYGLREEMTTTDN